VNGYADLILITAGVIVAAMALAAPTLKDHEACRDNTLLRAGTEKGAMTSRDALDTRADRVDTFAKKPTEDAL
jgi:hypothetical protein